MKSFGICVGASTLSIVELLRDDNSEISITKTLVKSHHGNPQEILLDSLKAIEIGKDSQVAITGRRLKQFVNLTPVSEPEAIETTLLHLNGRGKHFNAVMSAGGETFILYVLDRDGRITSVQAGNKCASGTGEFFLQQIGRMGISLREAIKSAEIERPYKVSGRCSVFCKSDCTHAMNKGVPKGRVVAGLCQMMAGKALEIMAQITKRDIMVIGGCSQNTVMVEYLKRGIKNLVIPKEAPYFEALGCALWALKNETTSFPGIKDLFQQERNTFLSLQPLRKFSHMVEFKEAASGEVGEGDRCIIGLDVGSTTTKAVLLRMADCKILASSYLRTNGNPVQASRGCYAELYGKLGGYADKIQILGLGATGSGRQIAGLHAMTDGVINEIIAHATGALYYDDGVDTIFEIGGQDAKYTYLTNGVASDYAMNEACSAGTGSFLEEAAKEALEIKMEEIAETALRGNRPPNFNDQCAAFIGSDIKNASHDGVSREDIVAGLVYSICMNYNNRVKGNRPVGRKVFMQGGVCYNRAVPLAMASLTGKHIIVPPEPGLIGAFGVALEIRRQIELGIMEEKSFSLKILKDREIEYGEPFICKGGKELCDRKCEIARIKIEGKVYPFGGACNQWYNLRSRIKVNTADLNYVSHYEKLIFNKYMLSSQELHLSDTSKTVGINKSFLSNTYFPLYHTFFSRLGFTILLPDAMDQEGMDRVNAPFCYPAEIAHGYFFNLLQKRPDYLFLPQIKGDYAEVETETGQTCPLSQGEPYYLSAAFKNHETCKKIHDKGRILNPVVNFSEDVAIVERQFIKMAKTMGVSKKEARTAFSEAMRVQQEVFNEMKDTGRRVLKELEEKPDEFAVVIFGRTYNAFVSEAHMGIPNKFASRNVKVIPLHYLTVTEDVPKDQMYWSAGQRILRAASFVEKHPQLFGCYITNFSCGPDSFLVGYFRDIMGKKPSLTLELDSHVADAGLETRIEAFTDIIKRYLEIEKERNDTGNLKKICPAKVLTRNNQQVYYDSTGEECSIFDSKVHLVIPSMGRFIAEAGAAIFRGIGINSSALPPADEKALKLGRGHTSCKECLPLLLVTGSLLQYLDERINDDERLICFMPTASGPCRYGQYSVFLNDLIVKLKIPNIALFSLSAENSYADLESHSLTKRLWFGVVLSDIFQEIYSVLLTNSVEPELSMSIFEREWGRVLNVLEYCQDFKEITKTLDITAVNLKQVPVKKMIEETPIVLLSGEIFARHDGISGQYIIEELAHRGFATEVSTVAEWIHYTDWCVKHKLSTGNYTFKDRASLYLRSCLMKRYEKVIRQIMAKSGLCRFKTENVDRIIKHTRHLMNPALVGEAILTIGASINEVIDHYCGVIAIGPFGCMPNRLAESILTCEMNMDGKLATGSKSKKVKMLRDKFLELPFLSIESDGNQFPQIITAKLEAFLLQAGRIHEEIKKYDMSK